VIINASISFNVSESVDDNEWIEYLKYENIDEGEAVKRLKKVIIDEIEHNFAYIQDMNVEITFTKQNKK